MLTLVKRILPRRLISLSIGVWLVLGFALVIGAFAAASAVALRSTRGATADLARMQQQFEPFSRSVRELGDGLATFDRVVLAYLRADTPGNRAAAVASAERVSGAANRTRTWSLVRFATDKPACERITDHQAEGFRLLDMQDDHRRTHCLGSSNRSRRWTGASRARAAAESSSGTA